MLGSPFTARLLAMLADRLAPGSPLADRILGWPGDAGPSGDSVPLRLAGGLHALVQTGRDAALAAVYADTAAHTGDALWQPVAAALAAHENFLMAWLNSPPQTNEVRRAAVLIAAGHWLTARFGLPLVLSELGASAGLNLLWDRYALDLPGLRLGPDDPALVLSPDWRGALPPHCPPEIAARAGVDLNPLDPVADRLRLLAYIWADQTDRLTRTKAALAEAVRLRPPVARADAVDWLDTRLANRHAGHLHLVFHTIAWQYFPPAAQARGEALLAAAGARATADAPLARLAMEADATPGSAAVTLNLWPGNVRLVMGRADFHGRWVEWLASAP
ncbi:DUF2332 family protein [Fertoebacter nigrum]|uniref:DUF2332 family protein n=2 Tax=Fertoeibacter niger TaxID=2656921 RepID=A0A8X8H0X2_9RHOB|nr:DUF2332 family protein [Fertoeibacter niger]